MRVRKAGLYGPPALRRLLRAPRNQSIPEKTMAHSRSCCLVFAFAFLFVFGAGPAGAHHSHSMFDTSREVTVTGTVTVFSYRNPHVFLHLDVKDDKGVVTSWAIEMSNIGNMQSRGIHRSTFKVWD